jgi:FlaA1/EpsC-like NDP-sugar epimerase
MNECQKCGLTLKIIPPIEEVLRGGSHIPARDIDITDLLRRAPVELDDASIGELLADRRVMVTGAGGSIGSEICRQVLRYNPSELILVGRGENRLFHIDMELRESYPSTRLHVLVGDVTDRVRMGQIFETYRPEIVFHAAAHKHVPMMENNAGEAVKNNVLGTKCVADLADEYDVKVFVLISTDKAVNPTSVMGTTKHLAERYVNALSSESTTQFVVVRFGNVLGSAGSVVPIFKSQIRRGGPITITDSKMTRYFMTIPEASQLVLQAASMGKGGEIYVLDMGEPVRILDLAQDMIRLSGLPQGSIEITSTGVRPGEKLYEELYFEEEQTLPTTHPKVRAAAHRLAEFAEVSRAIADLADLTAQPAAVIRAKLQELVPEYQPRKALTEAQRAASRL